MKTSNLKKLITRIALICGLAAGSTFVLPSAVSAQEAPQAREGQRARQGRGHHRRGHGGHLFRQLNLSDNQKAQLQAIRQSAHEQKRELRAAGRSEATRAQMRTLRTETRQLMMDVLTPAQKTQLEQLRAAKSAERANRRMARMTEKLELTPAQASRIEAIFEAAKSQRQALRNGSAAGDERREAMRALRERTHAAVDAVLTPAQRAKKAERGERGHRQGRHGNRGSRGAPTTQ